MLAAVREEPQASQDEVVMLSSQHPPARSQQSQPESTGSTSHQVDHWTCGYRSMCALLKVLHLMEEGSFKTDPPTVITCTLADIESMRTGKAPAVYALKSGWLGYLPAGLFWKPEWKMDPDWDTTISPFPENYPTEWYSPGHVKLLSSLSMNNIRLYERASRRPQGGGRKDSNRLVMVIVKPAFAENKLSVRDDWIQDILYVQCRSSRHNDAMLSVDDFFNHGTPNGYCRPGYCRQTRREGAGSP
jgi:hypothetical protein